MLLFLNEDVCTDCSVQECVDPYVPIDLYHPALEAVFNILMPCEFVDTAEANLYNFNKADYDALNRTLANFDWARIETMDDIDVAVAFFNHSVTSLFDQHVPVTRPRRKPPWCNARLRKLKHARASALKRYSRERNQFTKRNFESSSNLYRRYNRFLCSKYVDRKQSELKQNPKSFWKFINEKSSETVFRLACSLVKVALTQRKKNVVFSPIISPVCSTPILRRINKLRPLYSMFLNTLYLWVHYNSPLMRSWMLSVE